MGQRRAGLIKKFASIVGQRHLMVALEVRRADVRRVTPRSLAAVTQQSDQLRLGDLDLSGEPYELGLELGPDLGNLVSGPRLLAVTDREVTGADRPARGNCAVKGGANAVARLRSDRTAGR